jgi:sulfur relay (sulfurtransferase) complex TusBCD TusD component (DsrE family)
MKYSIFINPHSKNSFATHHALKFVDALLCDGQELISVFFYGYSVKYAFQHHQQWQAIAANKVKLIACSTIADSYEKSDEEVLDYFELAGLGQWIAAVYEADKNIEFI